MIKPHIIKINGKIWVGKRTHHPILSAFPMALQLERYTIMQHTSMKLIYLKRTIFLSFSTELPLYMRFRYYSRFS